MTLNFKNPQFQQFYDLNIAANVQFANDSLMIKNATKANIYLAEVDREIANLRAAIPSAKQDIKSLEEMQSLLLARVLDLDERSFFLNSISAQGAYDPEKTHPSSLIDFAPTGIYRPAGVMNCGLNSLFQCVMNTHLPRSILARRNGNCKTLKPLVNLYNKAQAYGLPVAEGLDMNILRRWSASAISTSSSSQEDAFDIWQVMADKLNIRPVIEQTCKRRGLSPSITKIQEPAIRLKVTEQRAGFFNLIEEFFNTTSDEGEIIERRFQEAPEVLVVQADRTHWTPETGQCNLSTPLDQVPEYFKTKKSWMAEKRDPVGYALKGCIIQGGTLQSGHYVSLQRKPDGWYLIDDANVRAVSDREAQSLLKKGYLFFYEKSDRPMASSRRVKIPFMSSAPSIPASRRTEKPSFSSSVLAVSLFALGILALAI